jgi:hypothetical protein
MSRIVNDLRRRGQILRRQTAAVDACAAGHAFLGHNRGLARSCVRKAAANAVEPEPRITRS